jgi:hypothetical protein
MEFGAWYGKQAKSLLEKTLCRISSLTTRERKQAEVREK